MNCLTLNKETPSLIEGDPKIFVFASIFIIRLLKHI